ncbi:MAG: peptidase [Bacteroidetes bacterium]|nr:peptidase [Bacteroidota bacterium]
MRQQLDSLSGIYNFTLEEVKTDSFFKEKYLLNFEQAVDHQNPETTKFNQRVFISHIDSNAPVVFITEGYDARQAENTKFVSELAGLLNTNQVCVEHRYFGESVPDTLSWMHLTVANAAADHHRITKVLRLIYAGKWIGSGISKGGQTAIYHRYFYPEDVDMSVPYVAPLNFSSEDLRVYKFLDSVGNEDCRERVFQFQKELLQHKSKYISEFEKLAKKRKLNYSMEIEKAFELVVLEYSFAFWQWGYVDCNSIPLDYSNPKSIITHLDQVAGLKWVSNEGIEEIQAFFYQAMREIGFYGYNIESFKSWTIHQRNPTFEFTLPEGVSVEFEPQLMQDIDCFIRHEANNMVFIYGEYDPWSAPAVELTYHTNSLKVVKPAGSHRTRINNLPSEQRALVLDSLQKWLRD